MPSAAAVARGNSSDWTPSQPRRTRPCARIWSITPRTMFTGIAKLMPSVPEVLREHRGVDADQLAVAY